MRDHIARWHELHPLPLCSPNICLLLPLLYFKQDMRLKGTFLFCCVTYKMSWGLSVYGSMLDGDNTACVDCGVASSSVLSVCLCCVLNINRAEKCPEWNEFVAAWSLSFLMMVISGVEEGNTLLCSTAVKQMTVFATALLPAPFQCLIWAGTWPGVCILTSWLR